MGGINMRGINMMKFLVRYKTLARVALAIVLVGVMAASLWFTSPSPVKALDVSFPSLPASGTLGQTYYFQVKVTVGNNELVPIQSIDLNIYNSANATYKATSTNLTLINGGSSNYTSVQTGGGSVNITATAVNWITGFSTNGSASWNGTIYNFGYGYGFVGPSSITYNVAWTPPAGWPGGNYQIDTTIKASGQTFTQASSTFTLQVGLLAETSISQALDIATNATGVRVNINRIKNPTDNSTATIPGGIGSYTARASSAPASGIQFLVVKGVPPFGNPTFDNVTGSFSLATVSSPPQAPTTVALVIPILTGNATTSYSLTVVFEAIGAAGQAGLNVPEERSNSITLLRGDAWVDGAVTVTDSLAIKQLLVGQLTLSDINPLNAATPNHDGAGGDKISITDALAIEQFKVGQINAYYQ